MSTQSTEGEVLPSPRLPSPVAARPPLPLGRGFVALLPLLLLTACGPAPARQAEICAIQALPARPGVDRFGASPRVERKAQAVGEVYGPGVFGGYHLRWWGLCGHRADTTDMLLIGPMPWALTKGGERAHGHQVSYGTCYHRREGDRWRTVACRINP